MRQDIVVQVFGWVTKQTEQNRCPKTGPLAPDPDLLLTLTIPDTAGTSRHPAGKYPDTRSSKSNQASGTPDCHSRSYPPYCSPLHPSSLSFSSRSVLSSHEHTVMSTLSISPCHHHELTLSASYTECSIHQVQHTPRIVCRPFILTISS